jgi:hypothetical protein
LFGQHKGAARAGRWKSDTLRHTCGATNDHARAICRQTPGG